jgi:hypothetical protein
MLGRKEGGRKEEEPGRGDVREKGRRKRK